MEAAIQPDKIISHVSDKSYLFNHLNQEEFKENLMAGIELIQRKMLSVDKPFSGVLPQELSEKFKELDFNKPSGSLEAALKEVEKLYMDHAIYFHHPKYVAHLNCPVVIPSILAELILSSVNSSLDTWDQSAGGTLMEQKLIEWTSERIGLGPAADGIFTSGGTQSNLMAMLLARDHYCRNRLKHLTKVQGLPRESHRFRIFTSEASHFSIQKSLAILGLGYAAAVSVPCDRNFRMNILELEKEIRKCIEHDQLPIAVVATAGTTDFGSIDPLPEVAEVCKEYGLWMHVDAAYGCGLLVSPTHRNRIEGIQHADSVTIDYHKSFFQPVSCGAFLVKDKQNLSVVTHHADYLNPLSQSKEGTPNQVNKSIQTTRRFDALKLWLTLRIMGPDSIGRSFDEVIELTRRVFLLLHSEETIELIHQPELSTLVFRYRPARPCSEKTMDEVNAYIRKALFRSGEAVIAGTKVQGKQYLKFTLLNPATTIQDIQEVLKMIKQHGQNYFNQKFKSETISYE